MGDAEEVFAEPDELEQDEGVIDGLHPPTLEQNNPKIVTSTVSTVLSFLAFNGWYLVILFGIGMFAWKNFQPILKRWLRKREEEQEAALHHKNPDLLLNKLRVMDEARRKQQEKYNLEAAKNLEKKLEKEKMINEKKLAELESMQPGQGYRLKDKPSATASNSASNGASNSASNGASNSASNSSTQGKPTTKKVKLRPEYNPLTGDIGGSSSCQWRPSRRGQSGGG